MKIRQESVDLIKSGKKTVVFRKIRQFEKVIYYSMKKGYFSYQFEINNNYCIFNIRNFEIFFKGYEIIKKDILFKWLDEIISYADENEIEICETTYGCELLEIQEKLNCHLPNWLIDNLDWILEEKIVKDELIESSMSYTEHITYRNYEFLEEYYKDEEDILVMFIDMEKTLKVNKRNEE